MRRFDLGVGDDLPMGVMRAPKSPKRKTTAAKLRSWRVAILRNRSHYLGDVQAADEKAAEAAAVVEFKLTDDRKRVVVQERDG